MDRTRQLDKVDVKILQQLQANARIAMTELAEKVGLSTTPCTERVRRLEREGVIEGYHARLNPQALAGRQPAGIRGDQTVGQIRRHLRCLPP